MDNQSDQLYRIKSGASISIKEHDNDGKRMLSSRSKKLLLSRAPSYPAFAVDLSDDQTSEIIERRNLHSQIMAKNPNIFKKKSLPESASSQVHHNQIVKDLLSDMHKLKDEKDICPHKKFTYSIKSEKDLRDKIALDEYHFQTMKPMEDFIRPDDSSTPRTTGYSSGHIRSILKLDVFGPAQSKEVEKERIKGTLPTSPNVDRFVLIDPEYSLRPVSSASSRSSNSSFDKTSFSNFSQKSPSLSPGLSMNTNRSQFMRPRTTDSINSMNQSISWKDRENIDSYVRRKEWYKNYVKRKNESIKNRELFKQQENHLKWQRQQGEHLKKSIKSFEKHLVLAKFTT